MMSFNSLTNKHKMILEIDGSTALINTLDITYEEPIELSIFLKDVSKKLQENNIKIIIQQVTENDWEHILEPLGYFEYVNKNEEFKYVNISVLVETFPVAIMASFFD